VNNENKVYQKFVISKVDGTPVDPEAKYFVLRIDKQDEWGKVCRRALRRLANDVEAMLNNPEFAKSIREYADSNTDFLNEPRVQALKDLRGGE
jgi:hypothetical protein